MKIFFKNGLLSTVFLAAIFFSFQTASAATINVNSTADILDVDGNCTLREAIEAANTNAAVDGCNAGELMPVEDTVIVPSGNYILNLPGQAEDSNQTGDLDITDIVTIKGEGVASTVIDGNHFDRAFHLQPGVLVRFADMSIVNGEVDFGGGIYVGDGAMMFLENLRFQGNTATADGGAVYAALNSTILVYGTSFINNFAENGGAIYNTGFIKNISASSFIENHAQTMGGALDNEGALEIIQNSHFQSNSSLEGGAVYNTQINVKIEGCAFTENVANYAGGAVLNDGTMIITNNTFYSNTTSINNPLSSGGAIVNTNQLMAINNTINQNSSSNGAIFSDNLGHTSLLNNLIVNNIGGNCVGTVLTNDGFNLQFGDDSCGVTVTQAPVNPLSANGLADNGGITKTIALENNNSGAINGGASLFCPPTDQRGYSRIGICDIGAFEYPKYLSLTTLSVIPATTTLGQTVTFTAIVNDGGEGVNVAPTGTVTFTEGGNPVGGAGQVVYTTDQNNDLMATITSSGLLIGNHDIVATYSGDQTFDASTSQVLVKITNTAPVALDDAYNATKNTTLAVSTADGVLKNDTDAENHNLIVDVASIVNPAHGTLTLNIDGSFSYVPAADYVGLDSFSYKANDGISSSMNSGAVNLNIKDMSSTTVIGSPATLTVGQSVKFTATISGPKGIPTGTVIFTENGNPVTGAGVVNYMNANGNLIAEITTTALTQGSHDIVANYSGDQVYLSGISVDPAHVDVQAQVQSGGNNVQVTGVTGGGGGLISVKSKNIKQAVETGASTVVASENTSSFCAGYKDVYGTDCKPYEVMKEKTIFTGDDLFGKSDIFKRGEAIKVAQIAFKSGFVEGEDYCKGANPFSDMIAGKDPMVQRACFAKAAKMIYGHLGGVDLGKYLAEMPITQSEFGAILLRNTDQATQLKKVYDQNLNKGNPWYLGYMEYMAQNELAIDSNPQKALTRADALQITYNFYLKGFIK